MLFGSDVGCERVQDDEPFDWETNAATNIGQGRRVGAKGGSHGSGREKDTERRERKEREREKRDKEELRQRSRDQRAAAVVEVHVRAGGGDGASGGGGGGGASEMDYKYFSNNVGGERRGSTLQHATAAPNASLLPVVEPELTVEAPYRPGGARDAQPQAYAPGGNAARSRGDMAAASGDAGATSEAREKQSIHANAVRICFSVITRGSCPKVECSLFHPPRNPPRPAVVRAAPLLTSPAPPAPSDVFSLTVFSQRAQSRLVPPRTMTGTVLGLHLSQVRTQRLPALPLDGGGGDRISPMRRAAKQSAHQQCVQVNGPVMHPCACFPVGAAPAHSCDRTRAVARQRHPWLTCCCRGDATPSCRLLGVRVSSCHTAGAGRLRPGNACVSDGAA